LSIYNVDKLMLEARKLAAEYRRATGKPLGISNEIAVYDVIRIMNLEAVDANAGGYDAIGKGEREGRRIQIKGRSIVSGSTSSHRIGQIKIEQKWDSVMLILLDENYEPVEIHEADRETIVNVVKQSSKKRRNRGAMSVARFKNIGQCVWSQSKESTR